VLLPAFSTFSRLLATKKGDLQATLSLRYL
jgi:hypothetical protein